MAGENIGNITSTCQRERFMLTLRREESIDDGVGLYGDATSAIRRRVETYVWLLWSPREHHTRHGRNTSKHNRQYSLSHHLARHDTFTTANTDEDIDAVGVNATSPLIAAWSMSVSCRTLVG